MWVDLAQAAKVSEWVWAGGSGERRASTASIASSAKRGVWCFARSSAVAVPVARRAMFVVRAGVEEERVLARGIQLDESDGAHRRGHMLANGPQVTQGHSKRAWVLWGVRHAELHDHVPCLLRRIVLRAYLHASMHIVARPGRGMHRRRQRQHGVAPCHGWRERGARDVPGALSCHYRRMYRVAKSRINIRGPAR